MSRKGNYPDGNELPTEKVLLVDSIEFAWTDILTEDSVIEASITFIAHGIDSQLDEQQQIWIVGPGKGQRIVDAFQQLVDQGPPPLVNS